MHQTSWKDIAELVGIAAIVASLIFVGLQMKQSQEVALTDSINGTIQRHGILRQQIIENSDIWYRACAGEELEPHEKLIANSIFNAYIENALFTYVTSQQGVVQSDLLSQQIIRRVAAQYWLYPGMRIMLESRTNWSQGADRSTSNANNDVSQFVQATRARMAELMSQEPELEPDLSWCGLR